MARCPGPGRRTHVRLVVNGGMEAGPGQLILQVPAELGAAEVERLRTALDRGVGAQCEMVLDLGGLRLLDAVGMRFLMSVRQRVGIRLQGTRDRPLLVFLLLRLDGLAAGVPGPGSGHPPQSRPRPLPNTAWPLAFEA